MRVVLEVSEGPKRGTRFVFSDQQVVLMGRSERCGAFCLGNDPKLSRIHVIVEIDPPSCRIRDLGSANHTFVNDQKVIEADLVAGDTVCLGTSTCLVMSVEGGSEAISRTEGVFLADVAHYAGQGPAVGAKSILPCFRCWSEFESSGEQSENDVAVCDDCRALMASNDEAVPGYRILKRIADGGMGVVWLAEDTRTEVTVAIKTVIPEINSNARAIQMFLRETGISLQLHHPNIVETISAGQFGGRMFVVMEYVEGFSAYDELQKSGGRMDVQDVVAIGIQVLDALEYAHSEGVVHRDVKPHNILLTGCSGRYNVKLGDFGLARDYRTSGTAGLTQQGDVRGSYPYMPREQVLNPANVGPKADLFALGATLYQLLTGAHAYNFRREVSPLLTILDTAPVPVEDRGVPIAPKLAALINKSLSVDPVNRPANAASMRSELAEIVTGEFT